MKRGTMDAEPVAPVNEAYETGELSIVGMASSSGETNVQRRRAEVDRRHAMVADLLQQRGWDAVVLSQPDLLAWMTTGGLLDVPDRPVGEGIAVYLNANLRCLVVRREHARRLFREEIDELGFVLKEVPWTDPLSSILVGLTNGKTIGTDLPGAPGYDPHLRDYLTTLLAPVDFARYNSLAGRVSHAVEAALRTVQPGESEWDLLGNLHHRLRRRGMDPWHVHLAGDRRMDTDGRARGQARPFSQGACLCVTGQRRGFYYTTARMMVWSDADPVSARRIETYHDASTICSILCRRSVPGMPIKELVRLAISVYGDLGHEFAWRDAPLGALSGYRAPAEPLTLDSPHTLEPGMVISWMPTLGGIIAAETVLVTASGPHVLTHTDGWPMSTEGRPEVLVRRHAGSIQE